MAVAENGGLKELVDKAESRVEAGEPMSIGLIQRIAGGRAYGPLLLFPALVAMSPVTIVPGVPTLIGLTTVIVAGQVVLGRESIWLPSWLKSIKLPERQTKKLVEFLKPVGEKADELVKPRATVLTSWPLRRIGAAVCMLVGLAMPITEVIPFTSTWAGAIIATYGLAITARDGFLALAWACLVACIALVAAAVLL